MKFLVVFLFMQCQMLVFACSASASNDNGSLMASDLVEITTGGFIPKKCHDAEYKGFIAQDVVCT